MNIRLVACLVSTASVLFACSSSDEPSNSSSSSSGGSSSSSGAASDGGASSSSSSSGSSSGSTDGGDGNWCATLKACCDRIANETTKKQCTDSWTDTGAPTNPAGADQGCKVLYGAAYAGQCK